MPIDPSKAEAYLLQAGWKCKSRTGGADWERPTDPPKRRERKGPNGEPIIVDGVPVTLLVAPIQWPLYTLAQALEIQQGIDRDAGKTSPDLTASTTPDERGGKDGNKTPATLLTGWHEITAALKMNYRDRSKVKSLNERFDGPIRNHGQGTQPIVTKDELLSWWDTLAQKQQEMAARRDGKALSAEGQYPYGRDGQVAPEIGGSIKKRRRKK